MTRKLAFVGGGSLVCAVASFTFFVGLPRDWGPCGGQPCPPYIRVLGLDLTPQQTVGVSVVGGVILGGLFGFFLEWATTRRSAERRIALVLLGIVTGGVAGVVFGYYQPVDCIPDGDICVGSFKALFDRLYAVPIALMLYTVVGLLIGAIVGWTSCWDS